MKKIDVVFDKLSSDKILLNEFLKKKTLEEMYEFCLTIDDSVTKEEFDEYVSEAFVKYNKFLDKRIDELDLGNVSGGASPENALIKAIAKAMKNEVTGESSAVLAAPILDNFGFLIASKDFLKYQLCPKRRLQHKCLNLCLCIYL